MSKNVPLNPIFHLIRGAFKSDFWKKLGFCPNQVDPLPESWDTQIKKNDVFFAFWAILSILFFHEKFHFFGLDNE